MPSPKMGFQRGNYSRFSFGRKRRERCAGASTAAEQNKGLLKDANDLDAKTGYINYGQDDQMQICGYRLSVFKNAVTWFFIVISGGVLRLVFHWCPHWLLFATCSPCPVETAEKVLITEWYKNKHKVYHVKMLAVLTPESVFKSEDRNEIDHPLTDKDGARSLSVHFSNGIFKEVDHLLVFRCKKLTYVYDADRHEFVKLRGLDVGVRSDVLHQNRGLTTQEQSLRRLVYGTNEIVVPEKSVFTLLFLEVLNPFYIFQLLSFGLWFADNYYYYAVCILLMSAIGIVISVMQTRKNQRNLKSTVHSSDVATIIRGHPKNILRDADGCAQLETETVSTELLVPGDVLEIPPHGCIMHCDAVLLTGNCIVNESMLTGESVPVTKIPMPNSSLVYYDAKEHTRHTLFCGTNVIQTRYYGSDKVLAVVVRTGFATAKGGLVRSILYPPPVDFRFERDSYRFVTLLAGIASVGFIYTVVTKVLRDVPASDLVLEALDLITIVVPPALPAAMTVGIFYAQRRLEKIKIYCISPRSINVSGSVDCVCFDKTGTLTEDGLDMLCVVPISSGCFSPPVQQIDSLPFDAFIYGMVSCHSLTTIDKKLSGDPMDLKIFESTGWIIEEHETSDNTKFDMIFPTVVKPPGNDLEDVQVGIIREFPFSSNSQRMGVIVRRLNGKSFEFYSKGSPEMILNFVRPESVPDDFSSVLEAYTQEGYRVIALAHRELNKMSYAKVHRVHREDIERDMDLLGLIVLENRLKQDTTPVIGMLNEARIRTIMVTGDNILTALSVAKDCGIITHGQSVITVNSDASSPPQLYFTLATAKSKRLSHLNGGGDFSVTDSASVASLETVESGTVVTTTQEYPQVYRPRPQSLFNNYRFAMTGMVWAVVRERHAELIPRLITRGAVFARMSPEQKQQLVEELQGLGYYVAMCGDGANDCGALKAAHTGISLSDTESSVASPFTSKNQNIACVPNVIKEGRAALVTSFGIFKYMASYSLCQFISVMILYSIDSNLTDFEYLYIDLCIISIFAVFWGWTKTYDGKLAKKPPQSSLISLPPILSLILQLALVIAFQVAAFEHVQTESWFVPFNATESDNKDSVGCSENYAVFTVSSFQYIILAYVFSKGKPYRQPIFRNIYFLLTGIILTAISIYLAIQPAQFLQKLLELAVPSDLNFKLYLLLYAFIHFVMAMTLEFLVDYLTPKICCRTGRSVPKYVSVERELSIDTKWPTLTSEIKSSPSPQLGPTVPKCTAEIVVEKKNSFDKNHVFNPLLEKPSEISLNPSKLPNGVRTSYDQLPVSSPVARNLNKLSESVPNVSYLNRQGDDREVAKATILEMDNFEFR